VGARGRQRRGPHGAAPEGGGWPFTRTARPEPRRQGGGLGAALLASVLGLCDETATPAYLEASSERNRLLYERNGFELTETFPMPLGGPPIREMWRDPIPPSQPPADSS
jgi:GNAT superfamily N-acetyltransferase